MTPDVRQLVLAQHGLDAGALGPIEVLRLPQPAVDEARSARPTGSPSADPLIVRSDALASAGLTARFDDATRTLLLSAPEDLAFRVIAVPAPAASPLVTRATLAAGEPASFVLAGATGPLAVASVDPRSLQFSVVHGWPAPPVEAWLATIDRSDRAVLDSGAEARASASRWEQTQAAGRIARLMRAPGSAGAAVEARRWLRGIEPGPRALIERFAVVCARTLAARLARLQTSLQPDDDSLEETWAWACWERDDLEGLRVLLREAGAGAALGAALQEPDATGRAVRFSWPSGIDVHDERLQRVSEGDPGAWWGSTRGHVAWW